MSSWMITAVKQRSRTLENASRDHWQDSGSKLEALGLNLESSGSGSESKLVGAVHARPDEISGRKWDIPRGKFVSQLVAKCYGALARRVEGKVNFY